MINDRDLRIDVIEKPCDGEMKYPRKFFVKIEHVPTKITVTRLSKSQKLAKEIAVEELAWLLEEYYGK